MDGYITLLRRSVFEFEDKKSRFIGEAMPVSTEAEALAFIEGIKKKFPDATHHVYAYVLRENSIARFTDDREPQGTAGMPVLDAIRKNGIVDAVVVVTRYFGGTLLGTGGLVRAYSSSALGALKEAEIVRYDVYATVNIEVSYSDYQKIGTVFDEIGFRTDNTVYSDKVLIEGSVLAAEYEKMLQKLIEATSGRLKCDKIREIFSY